ncbi:uroporphyrinogen-III C-methyltransferase [Epidermidibacterium keratini]|uniref:uroporphyrinogen-III C-methyltransferase n=1 Tax=Epidermidibacterium keratini TaxID=1891644 RepID=A0A7L4YKU3_9ACTN|nr:uroporphyrinogen-III C-methyltransferase [Epidermidibacterium keratini]QHB99870.1 uroporphyrinogen-III C-methyltransferase [Epidermidibacterium keratini]
MELDLAGRRVLVEGPRGAALISRLLSAGAQVSVSDASTTSVRDLVERGLVSEDTTGPFAAVLAADAWSPSSSGATQNDEYAGTVTLVGGGPGDPGLLTIAGIQAIQRADVVVYDRLAPLSSLDEAPADAELIDVGKIPRGEFTPQERINELLVTHAQAGKHVVRLKGGDSFVFGRGGEECQACVAAGVPVRVIPGVTSAVAVPELAGIPVTHRTASQGFAVVSGHVPPGDPRGTVEWSALARAGVSIVVLMGVANLAAICETLVDAGLGADTPAAVIVDGGLASQQVVRADVATLAKAAADEGVRSPAVTVIGAVAELGF